MKSKLFSIVALLMVASFVLTACGGTGAVETIIVTQIVEGEVVEVIVEVPAEVEMDDAVTLYHNWGTEPPTADPAMTTDTTSSALIGSTFIGLTDQDDATLEIIPSLATDWSASEDKLTWTNAVVLMAADALYHMTPASRLFSHQAWNGAGLSSSAEISRDARRIGSLEPFEGEQECLPLLSEGTSNPGRVQARSK